MPGQGKYTKFAPDATSRNARLQKLFKGNSTISNPFAELAGKEEEARLQVVERAKALLSPEVQKGDPGHFPNGVRMNYTGDENGVSVPDLTKVKWDSAGDAANGYMPDPTSPGPGTTDAKAKDKDPEISVEDQMGPGYVPGAPGTSTKSPNVTSPKVKENSTLGTGGKFGVDVTGFG